MARSGAYLEWILPASERFPDQFDEIDAAALSAAQTGWNAP